MKHTNRYKHHYIHSVFKSLTLVFFLALLFIGCNENQFADLEKYILAMKHEKTVHQKKPVYKSSKAHPIQYQAETLRAPFAEKDTSTKLGPPNPILNKHPLQAYPISVLRFEGTVTQHGSTIAYIKTPDNMLYPLKKGDLIGDHQGVVKDIFSDHIIISETETQQGQKQIEHMITLQLKDQH